MTEQIIDLGDKVRDRVSGLVGICTAITKYLNGCRRVVIQPQETHEGKPVESYYVDEPQCEVLEKGVIVTEFSKADAQKLATAPGGPPSIVKSRKSPPNR